MALAGELSTALRRAIALLDTEAGSVASNLSFEDSQRPMKKLPQVALIASGKLLNCFILDLPEFKERMGPVKSASMRVASRISNTCP
jgi:hypothetical protein